MILHARLPVAPLALSLLLHLPSPVRGQQASVEGAPADVADRIDAVVAPQAEAGLLSGIILVVRGSDVLFRRGYGFADWEHRVPVSAATRFGIGSITKPMTETLVRILEGDGRLDLDAPVEAYLPGFPRGPDGAAPTVGHLLTHRSGVPHRVTDPLEETRVLRAADVVARVRETGLLFDPGTRRLYSSAGFTVLARVVEVVEGRPFEAVVADRVFRPSRMESAISETGQRLMPDRAEPHRLGSHEGRIAVKLAPYKDLRFLTGAGSIYATAEDLSGFVRAVLTGVFGDDLARETIGADPSAWGGWYGRTNGYEASVDFLPAEDLIFVFLSNLQSAANWQARARIRDILAGSPAAAVPLPPPPAARFEEPEPIVGSYGPAEITLVDGRLFRGDNEFYPIEGRRYYIPGSGTVMWFRRTPSGEVDALVSVGGGGQETVLPRSGGDGFTPPGDSR